MNDPDSPPLAGAIQVLKVHPLYIKAIVHGQRWVFPNWGAVLHAATRPPDDLNHQRAALERKRP